MLKSTKLYSLAVTLVLILSACNNATEGDMKHENNHGSHGNDQQQGKPSTQKGQVKVEWKTTIDKVKQNGEIQLAVKDRMGKPITEFKINHEKRMHLILVSEDLAFFEHLHPVDRGAGLFVAKTSVPFGGKYKAYADFIPQDEKQLTEMHEFQVAGEQQQQPLQSEKTWVKEVEGKQITLHFDGALKANRERMLTFQLQEAKSKQPISDLEQYLGAVGHVVIISQDTKQYLHVHPMEEKSTGPKAQFHTTFPHSGNYKIWAQFRHKGKVFTVPFVVEVK